MEDGRRDNEGVDWFDETKQGFIQKPGALKIYDGALSDEFCDELIEIFNLNLEAVQTMVGDNSQFQEYEYTINHKEEDIHGRLMAHIGELYKHYLKDLGTPNLINLSGFEEMKIRKYEKEVGYFDLHLDANDHKSSIRAVSFLFFLDDNAGNIDYPMQGMGVEPRKGRVIMHPVSWEYPKNQHISPKNDAFTLETYLHFT